MPKIVLVIMFFLVAAGCNSRDNFTTGIWIVASSDSGEKLFKKGAIIEFKGDSIRFTMDGENISYPYILSGNRLLVNVGIAKRLFEIEPAVDTIILQELYQQNPVVIKLARRQ